MTSAEVAVEIIKALGWPVGGTILCLILLPTLRGVLQRLTSISYGGLRLELPSMVSDLALRTRRSSDDADAVVVPPTPSGGSTTTVLTTWASVENAIAELAMVHGIGDVPTRNRISQLYLLGL